MKLREKTESFLNFQKKEESSEGNRLKTEKGHPAVERYLSEVGGQMRSSRIKQSTLDELEGHIHEQAEEYIREGEEEASAYERAVKEMGDPVDVGISFDRIHRPHLEWRFLLIIAGVSLFSLFLEYILQEAVDAHDVYFPDYCVHLLSGLAAMFFVYRIDYSFIRGKSIYFAVGFFTFFLLMLLMNGRNINGAEYFASLHFGTYHGILAVSHFFPLYLPVFAGVLYDLRGRKAWKAVSGIFVFSVFPVIYTYGVGDNAMTVVLLLSEITLMVTAVRLGWYTLSKKNVLLAAGGVLTGGLLMFVTLGRSLTSGYHLMRLQSWLDALSGRDNVYNMASERIRDIFGDSVWIGKSDTASQGVMMIPANMQEYVLANISANCGKLAVILVLGIFVFLGSYIFRISVMQKNQLGKMMGISCGVVLLAEAFVNSGMVFRLFPFASGHLPFLSHGGTGMIVSYALLGIVLSIFRYKDILGPENTVVKEPFQPSA
ncbi:MAG: FtsW/RodA/SpoVE family cell cycle protein [Lachnospiraceae bacterium]|nr:FtsW/RodA/SpoVE family cell cycle protein [Lachnospiraceae bacterium]